MPMLVRLKRKDRSQRTKERQAQIRQLFEHHKIRHRDSRSWVCFQPHKDGGWDSNLWFEAVVLYGGTLLVNGDIDLMHFAYYGKHENPEQVLRWMGASRDLGYYVAQKASIGMTLPYDATESVIHSVDDEVWMDDAIDRIEDHIGRKLDTSEPIDLKALDVPEWLRELVYHAGSWGVRSAIESGLLNEADDSGDIDWGKVPSDRLICAHEALRKLVLLLDEEHARSATETTSAE